MITTSMVTFTTTHTHVSYDPVFGLIVEQHFGEPPSVVFYAVTNHDHDKLAELVALMQQHFNEDDGQDVAVSDVRWTALQPQLTALGLGEVVYDAPPLQDGQPCE